MAFPDLSQPFPPALYAVCGPPIGLFFYAWTTRADIHYIVPMIGIPIFSGSSLVVFQCITVYVPTSHPLHAASLFAENDLFQAGFAAGAVIFAGPSSPKLESRGAEASLAVFRWCVYSVFSPCTALVLTSGRRTNSGWLEEAE